MSDGSSIAAVPGSGDVRETGRLTVKDAGMPVEQLNELEIVKGEIYANVYQTHRIARISPKSGQVVGWIDLTGLLSARESAGVDVLNGIAYDAAKDRLFVTGKLWPKLFEIQIVRTLIGKGTVPFSQWVPGSTLSSPSFAIMSSADVGGLTALSTARIFPSFPM